MRYVWSLLEIGPDRQLGDFAVLRAILITACLVAASPSVAQQVRVITRDIEHIYGPGGEMLDDAELRARNQRALEYIQIEKQQAIQMHQLELVVERFRLDRNFSALRLWR